MDLEVGDLEQLLRREGIDPGCVAEAVAGGLGVAPQIRDAGSPQGQRWGAKTAVVGLLLLRRREIARLGYDADQARQCKTGDASFEMSLALIPEDQVGRCFAMVPQGAAQDSSSPSGATLPGQVETPRRRPERSATTTVGDGRRPRAADDSARSLREAGNASDDALAMRRARSEVAGGPRSPTSNCGWSVPPPPLVPPPPPTAEILARGRAASSSGGAARRRGGRCSVM